MQHAKWMVKRACYILEDAPYFKGGSVEEDWAYLVIEGDDAILRWPELESGYYGDYDMSSDSAKFPCSLLLLDDSDLKKWKDEQKTLYDRNEREKEKKAAEAHAKQRERNERLMYDVLKQKYG